MVGTIKKIKIQQLSSACHSANIPLYYYVFSLISLYSMTGLSVYLEINKSTAW